MLNRGHWTHSNENICDLPKNSILFSFIFHHFGADKKTKQIKVAKSMMEVPQWHCLRYFKHDIHLMRRCRNYRVPMLRRPLED